MLFALFKESDIRPLIGHLFPVPIGELDLRPFIGTPFPFPILFCGVRCKTIDWLSVSYSVFFCGVGRKTIYWHSVSHLFSELDVRPFIGILFPVLFSLNMLAYCFVVYSRGWYLLGSSTYDLKRGTPNEVLHPLTFTLLFP
jgi:hypothetical protein